MCVICIEMIKSCLLLTIHTVYEHVIVSPINLQYRFNNNKDEIFGMFVLEWVTLDNGSQEKKELKEYETPYWTPLFFLLFWYWAYSFFFYQPRPKKTTTMMNATIQTVFNLYVYIYIEWIRWCLLNFHLVVGFITKENGIGRRRGRGRGREGNKESNSKTMVENCSYYIYS